MCKKKNCFKNTELCRKEALFKYTSENLNSKNTIKNI